MTQPPARSHLFDTVYADEDLGEVADPFTLGASPGGHTLVQGHCPRCRGRTATEYRRGVPGTGTATGTKGPREDAELLVQERHFCECRHPHPDLPPNAVFIGCGASWYVRNLVPAAASGGTP
ncbi:hypothetical protein [Streptomyces sp. NPDC059063]|uniref:hypothetical protein n=1 Tax=unclassified Streptomyces TaxID=2593676 RepID=UPI00367E1CDE